jgi:hypothetical protein
MLLLLLLPRRQLAAHRDTLIAAASVGQACQAALALLGGSFWAAALMPPTVGRAARLWWVLDVAGLQPLLRVCSAADAAALVPLDCLAAALVAALAVCHVSVPLKAAAALFLGALLLDAAASCSSCCFERQLRRQFARQLHQD